MIITCDACTKRYVVDTQSLGGEGRMVRCVSCGHSWKAFPLKESILDLFPEKVSSDLASSLPKKRTKLFLGIFLSLGISAVLGGVILGREVIVTSWPSFHPYYKAVGLSVDPLGTGLSLQHVSVVPLHLNREKSLVIKGFVLNTTHEVKYLPSLKVKAFGSCKDLTWWEKTLNFFRGVKHVNPHLCLVSSWKHRFPETRLFPGEKAYFETAPEPALPLATDLTIGF